MAIVLVAFFAACDLRNELTSSADDVGDSVPVNSAPQASADDPNSAFDLLILDDRVLDPASGRDDVLNVGIKDGSIVALTTDESQRRTFINAADHFKAIEGKDQPYIVKHAGQTLPGPAFRHIATAEQIEEMRELLQQGIDAGSLSIGLLLDYTSPALSAAELRMILEVAAANNTAAFAHIRRGVNGDIQPLMDFPPLSQ